MPGLPGRTGRISGRGPILTAGEHVLTVSGLEPEVRYDVLYLTDEPSFMPEDGRLRQ